MEYRAKAQKTGIIPRRFHPRSFASILVEEANKDGGTARDFLAAEALTKPTQHFPARKFCPASGLEGVYREPRSNIYYANMFALEQIRERCPPWLNLTGAVAFHDKNFDSWIASKIDYPSEARAVFKFCGASDDVANIKFVVISGRKS